MSWTDTLRGVAYGDAWGAGHEFWPYERITATYGPTGPDFPASATITDDTQMTLALADALHATDGWLAAGVQDEVVHQFLGWLDDPDNTADRAPGNTCLGALEHIEAGDPWYVASVARSKGCGTVMRTAAAAQLAEDVWRPVAAFQSVVTHGNATATVACLILTGLLREASTVGAGHLLDRAIALCESPELTAGVGAVIEPLLTFHDLDADEYFARGRAECLARLQDAAAALHGPLAGAPWSIDVCEVAGQGWVADEALAVALLAADLFPTDPVQALRRAVTTGGDSDSIGAVAGAILGAAHTSPWPAEWSGRLESRYAEWIARAATYWE